MQRIRPLTATDLETPTFLALLREAAGQSDAELKRLIAEALPRLENTGIVQDGEVLAFVSFSSDAAGTTIEYLAVDESQRGRNLGTALIRHVCERYPSLPVVAETDDDAVGFYRRLGFDVSPAPTDARWPDRRRYRCVLPALSEG
ncbi:ribosomal protein S18 acetylase RimI-like enzyme [Arthrobacter pigmenti]|uniref:Ribosomal protein S18 acetylase RimI-like enzyme n=1 Tax=Arthrobacter pigmenti TaxID=271432 RepID=A0A846RRC7_9MICC|nr:N-acetyltransferase [Arthrobacter pigmenti]NJC24110.1 ribosomal protein S18 acetylase RimI-like enzyme [Arthrobacter pigmenti]